MRGNLSGICPLRMQAGLRNSGGIRKVGSVVGRWGLETNGNLNEVL